MTPIPEIMAGVADGSLTPDAGVALVNEHLKAAADLDCFAGLAMQALMGDRAFLQDAVNAGSDKCAAVAAGAYAQANAMMNARP